MISITKYFIKNHRVTNIIVFLVFLTGVFSMLLLQREEMPVIDFEIMHINTVYPGAAPKDVEVNVTSKIEKKLQQVENIKKLTSLSMENRSIVVAEIDSSSADVEKTKKKITDAVNQVTDLPAAVTEKPLVTEINSNYPLIEVSLSGNISEKKLRLYALEFESRIREITGIAKVQKIGYRKREIKIDINVQKMQRELISFNTIMQAIQSRHVRQTGGTIDSYTSEKKVVTLAEYAKPLDVKDVILRSNYEGYNVRLKEIATIKDDYAKPQLIYRSNGRNAIAFMISKQHGYDIITLSDQVKKEINAFKKYLPANVSIDEVYDFSILTRSMLDIVASNAILGFILVLGVMFLFLDRRSAIWSAFGIPFSIFGAFILFKPFGISINMVSLGALIIIIGIIVDDAIVVTERIYSLKQQGMSNMKATVAGVKSMLQPVTASIITTIMAFLPVLFIPGIMGEFMQQIPIVVTITLLISLLEALLFIPAHIHKAKVKKTTSAINDKVDKIKSKYEMVMYNALQHRKKVILGYGIMLLLVFIASFLILDFKLEEDINPDYFAIVVDAPKGTPLLKTAEMVKPIEQLLLKIVPKITLKSYKTIVGNQNKSTDYLANGKHGSNYAIISVYLHPAEKRDITSEEIMQKLKPGLLKIKNQTGLQRADIEMLGFSSGSPIEITLIGNSDALRNDFENRIKAFLEKQKGVSVIESNNKRGKDELQIKMDYSLCAQMGISPSDVAKTMRTAFDGNVVTTVRSGNEDIDFRVRIDNAKHFRQKGILNLPVSNKHGRLIPLKYFAMLKKHAGVSEINHYDGKRSVTITAMLDENIITSYAINAKVKKEFTAIINATPGIRIKFDGQQQQRDMSMQGLYFALIIVVFAVFFLLVIIFNSYLQPVLIMSVIPFAVMGVFLTLMIHNHPLVFISLVGLLGLIGVVVNDTIVMISHINARCSKEGSSIKIIAASAADRFRPVILTTITTFAGLLPTAYGIGGDIPIIRRLVLTMAWGLLISTIVTLGFIPVIVSFTKLYHAADS